LLCKKKRSQEEKLTKNLPLKKKALPTTFLPMWGSAPRPRKPCKGLVKTLTKNNLLFFLLAQVFFFKKKKKKCCEKRQL